jgi:hypothetical protein
MVVNRRELVARIDRRMEALVHEKAKAVEDGRSIRAGQLERQIAELEWTVTTIDEME